MTDVEVASTAISAVFAGVSAVAALIAYRGAERAARNSEVAARRSFRLEWTREVLDWGGRAVASLSRAHELLSANAPTLPDASHEHLALLASLSGLADEGRFFFENRYKDKIGLEKPHAYRGIRPDLLTYLIRAYQVFQGALPSSQDADAYKRIIALKRSFVSDLQQIVDPRWLMENANYYEGEQEQKQRLVDAGVVTHA